MDPSADGPLGRERRLSAIMFSDMVGYTALLQKDEPRARRDRDRWRAALERETGENGGRILQYYGDGALCVFDSAIAAVTSGVGVQRSLSREPPVLLRVGIHTGDVVYDDEGVFGDGVNVAARIQSLASPGSVLLSAKVYDEIKNQPQLATASLGEFDLKNVERPVEVFAMVGEGITVPGRDALPSPTERVRKSVAVLPFVNMSPDPENEFFSDGITEELINLLTRAGGLQVTARTSSFAFKGKHEDIRDIAEKLGVQMILEGSVRKAADQVRITAQLIDASNGYHLFSDTYHRRLADIFELQDEIARAIVEAVQDRLDPPRAKTRRQWEERFGRLEAVLDSQLASSRTTPEAHASYLHGLHEYHKWTPEALKRAVQHFDRCLSVDPGYAPAHAARSRAYGFIASSGQAESEASWKAAEAAARRAVELDPSLGDGHVALGMGELFYRWDVDAAYQHLQKGVGLNPGSALARQAVGCHLIVIGESERAVEEMELAAQLDPLSMLMQYTVGWALTEAARYQDAIEICDRILETDPTFRAAHEGKGMCLMELGEPELAAREFERIVEITGDPYKGLAPRGYNFGRMGRTDEARRCLEMIHERARLRPDLSLEIDLTIVYASLGELDHAFDFFERAAQKRLAEVLFSVNSPMWRELRGHARYWDIVGRYGLVEIARNRPGRAA